MKYAKVYFEDVAVGGEMPRWSRAHRADPAHALRGRLGRLQPHSPGRRFARAAAWATSSVTACSPWASWPSRSRLAGVGTTQKSGCASPASCAWATLLLAAARSSPSGPLRSRPRARPGGLELWAENQKGEKVVTGARRSTSSRARPSRGRTEGGRHLDRPPVQEFAEGASVTKGQSAHGISAGATHSTRSFSWQWSACRRDGGAVHDDHDGEPG